MNNFFILSHRCWRYTKIMSIKKQSMYYTKFKTHCLNNKKPYLREEKKRLSLAIAISFKTEFLPFPKCLKFFRYLTSSITILML